MERADWREAGTVKRGIDLAFSRGDLPNAYFDAMVPVEAAVPITAWDENNARAAANTPKRF